MTQKSRKLVTITRQEAVYLLEMLYLHRLHLVNEYESLAGKGSRGLITARIKRCDLSIARISAVVHPFPSVSSY